jgi:dGTPase
MTPWGGFEGNAQTLHLLTDTLYQDSTGVRGMQPTRALLDGVLKYKKLFSEFPAPPERHFLYDSTGDRPRFVFAGRPAPAELREGRSIE